MTIEQVSTRRAPTFHKWAGVCAAVFSLGTAGCGGGSPLGNPPNVNNEEARGGQSLSFAYFQRCINPIYIAQLPIPGTATTNTCAGSGCHDNASGTGGAFRVIPSAAVVDLSNPANTADVIRNTDMYKNFYSSQGEVVFTAIGQSRLISKPLVRNVLHGGGLIFENDLDNNVRLIQYWMTHPAPAGQSEFSYDPAPGACPTQ